MNKYLKILKSPYNRVYWLASRGFYKHMSDEAYLKKMWKLYRGYNLDLENPKGFGEKLQWIKLYDRKPIYNTMVDKFEAKKYVASLIGDEYIINTLGVWNNADEIDFNTLPDKFVLKCTHDSGGIVICTDKSTLDIKAVRKKLNARLKQDFFLRGREWPYKNVTHRIIAEEYMEDSSTGELRDYKFFTFGGVPRVMYITKGIRGQSIVTADFFDMNFEHLDLEIDHKMAEIPPKRPQNFELMKELAAKLSRDTLQVRIDFYEVNGKVYFGEFTFFHCGGLEIIKPEKWESIWGDWIDLPIY